MDMGRFEMMGILITPDQAAFLLEFERTLDHYVAARRSRVWIERHLLWLERDEEYQRAYNHILNLIDLRIADQVYKQAIFGQLKRTPTKHGVIDNRTIATGLLQRLAENTMKNMSPKPAPPSSDKPTIVVLPAPEPMPQLRFVESQAPVEPDLQIKATE